MFDMFIRLMTFPKRQTHDPVSRDIAEDTASPHHQPDTTRTEETMKATIDTQRLPHAHVAALASKILFPHEDQKRFFTPNDTHVWKDAPTLYNLSKHSKADIRFHHIPHPDGEEYAAGPAPTATITVTAEDGIHDQLLASLAQWVEILIRERLRPQLAPTPAEAYLWATQILDGTTRTLSPEMCVAYGLNGHWATGGGIPSAVFIRAFRIVQAVGLVPGISYATALAAGTLTEHAARVRSLLTDFQRSTMLY